MANRKDWEEIKPLGGGGQSDVYLVRSPMRSQTRSACLNAIRKALDGDKRPELADAIWTYARPEYTSELGALKAFKIPPSAGASGRIRLPEEVEAAQRLENEIASLSSGAPGLPALLDHNLGERWIVTEFFPLGTLEDNRLRYKGNAQAALKAFRSLVQTVSSLHKDGTIHRDIKPANVFVKADNDLILGDFGIAFSPSAEERVTATGERVGPRDYMPQWANLGGRFDKVDASFDIYMLGKLLWTMIDGRSVLPREYQKDPRFDLVRSFPDDPSMHLANQILDRCVVEKHENCLASAQELLLMVETILRTMERGGQLLKPDVPRPCHVCGNGLYQPQDLRQNVNPIHDVAKDKSVGRIRFWVGGGGSDVTSLPIQVFACDNCGHVQLFKTTWSR